MRALVTGSEGFLGRHFTTALRACGYRVSRVDTLLGIDANQVFADRLMVGAVFDLVVHCAAVEPHRAAIDSRPMHLANNLQLDASMFSWAVRTGQKRVLYISSSAAYPVELQQAWDVTALGDAEPQLLGYRLREPDIDTEARTPDAGYGWLKLTGERMAIEANKAGLPVHVVRPFSGYGEDQSLNFPFPSIIRRAATGADPFPIWGSAEQVRDFIHVDDVVNGGLAMVDQDVRGPVNLCSGRATTMRELAELAWTTAGRPGKPRIEVDEDAPMGVAYRVGDPTLMQRFYQPKVSLEEGVTRALQA